MTVLKDVDVSSGKCLDRLRSPLHYKVGPVVPTKQIQSDVACVDPASICNAAVVSVRSPRSLMLHLNPVFHVNLAPFSKIAMQSFVGNTSSTQRIPCSPSPPSAEAICFVLFFF